MTATLAHRQSIPVLIAVPDDPDALRLIRLLVLILDFIWQHRYTFLRLAELGCDVGEFIGGVGLAASELGLEPILKIWLVGLFKLVLFL